MNEDNDVKVWSDRNIIGLGAPFVIATAIQNFSIYTGELFVTMREPPQKSHLLFAGKNTYHNTEDGTGIYFNSKFVIEDCYEFAKDHLDNVFGEWESKNERHKLEEKRWNLKHVEDWRNFLDKLRSQNDLPDAWITDVKAKTISPILKQYLAGFKGD